MSYLSPFSAIKFLFKKPVTVRYPKEEKKVSPIYRGFHTNDLDKCIGCGDCEAVCQCNAISMEPVEGKVAEPGKSNLSPVIDYGRCSYCGLCVEACPTNSLQMSKDFRYLSADTDSFRWRPDSTHSENPGFTVDKETSILDFERKSPDMLPAEKSMVSFAEQVKVYSKELAVEEANRCIECGLCAENCPINMRIPEYIAAIAEGDFEKSAKYIYEDNTLPGICGRVCTKHCEDVCALGEQGDPIAIRFLKRVPLEEIDYNSVIKPAVKDTKSKKVAIIGGGPSALTAAYDLSRWGYKTTVFEKNSSPGGAMLLCIPEYRLPIKAGLKDIDFLMSFGAELKLNTEIGKDIAFAEIMSEYDAVFLGIGLWKPTVPKMNVENHPKIVYAIDYLSKNKLGEKEFTGDNVVVIGGGNVAIDAARVAKRAQIIDNGHEGNVILASLEEREKMPAWADEIEAALEEHIEFNNGWGIDNIDADSKEIKGLSVKKVISMFDEQGRFNPSYDTANTLYLEADQIIIAAGQQPSFSFIPQDMMNKIEFAGRKIKVDSNGATSLPKLFAGGDIANRKGDIVSAIRDGHSAAVGIDKLLG